jgi:hypothetical protein
MVFLEKGALIWNSVDLLRVGPNGYLPLGD